MDVYRTYADEAGLDPDGRRRLAKAAAAARPALGDGGRARLDGAEAAIADPAPHTLPFARRWQQLSGPVAAKGVEDTALYIDTYLTARNEPGCEPDWPATSPEELHRRLAARGGHPLNATSTHDTKRSEDARMRIAALSELAGEWEERFDRWRELNGRHRPHPDAAPDGGEEWLLYQSLAGVWPLDVAARGSLPERIGTFAVKAAREAKTRTSWIEPDPDHERELEAFVAAVLDPANAEFLAELDAFARRVAEIGARSSLALLVLKFGAPGVPDIYWGNELPDLSLVDPDNRRPVDFPAHARMLEGLERRSTESRLDLARELAAGWESGLLKLHVTWCGLTLRRRLPGVFTGGAYVPLTATGRSAGHVVGFARTNEGRWVVAAVPRLTAELDGWGDTRLPLPDGAPTGWEDVLTGADVRGPEPAAAELFETLPAALLVSRS
jgi:(1->4)-alpha-D-glucan 1-alpha-D-glucosylmutase